MAAASSALAVTTASWMGDSVMFIPPRSRAHPLQLAAGHGLVHRTGAVVGDLLVESPRTIFVVQLVLGQLGGAKARFDAERHVTVMRPQILERGASLVPAPDVQEDLSPELANPQ